MRQITIQKRAWHDPRTKNIIVHVLRDLWKPFFSEIVCWQNNACYSHGKEKKQT